MRRQESGKWRGYCESSDAPKLEGRENQLLAGRWDDAHHTVVAISGTRAAQWINPAVLRYPQLSSIVSCGQNASCSKVDCIEGVHEQRICVPSVYLCTTSSITRAHSHGKQIILFFFVTLAMLSSVPASLPWLHANEFFSATSANSAYSLADSWWFSLMD